MPSDCISVTATGSPGAVSAFPSSTWRRSSRHSWSITTCRRIAATACALALSACGPAPAKFHATDITGADYARDFAATDHTGRPRTLADYRGKVVSVFFGYTHCPDVCPTSLATMKQVMEMLGPQAQRMQVLFITVDPERDTPALLAQYVPAFHPSFVGLYTDAARTAELAKQFKVFYQKQAGTTPDSYTVDHSAGTYLYDPQGRLRLYVRHGESAQNIAEDVRRLLEGG